MTYVPLPRFIFRAPLLPLEALKGRGTKVWRDPLARAGLMLASPDLAASVGVADGTTRSPGGAAVESRADLALDRYRRRAAFRPTPHGLWAGVGVGALGARTMVDTGEPEAVFAVTWKRLADLGRALLEQSAVRVDVRLRRAPSAIVGARTVLWLAPGADGLVEEKRAELDDLLISVLEATAEWTRWVTVAAAVRGHDGQDGHDGLDGQDGEVADDTHGGNGDGDGVDDLLLTMVDDGLLHADLTPPLVGPPPLDWMLARLDRGASDAEARREGTAAAEVWRDAAAEAKAARLAVVAGDLAALQESLRRLPGNATGATREALPAAGRASALSALAATLVFPPTARVSLSRTVVHRAARLAPLLFRLQDALSPPLAERTPAPALADALDATTELFGAGALDLRALQLGDYGVSPYEDDGDGDPPGWATNLPHPPRSLVTLLVDAVASAAQGGLVEVALRAEDLDPLLPMIDLPPTCELFLTPPATGAATSGGDGWLVGLHAPAGATWGRFAFALGARATPLLQDLVAAEDRARPGETRMDVLFSPSDALSDICAHPPLRARTLALTGWPDDDDSAVTVGDLELCVDAAALEPLGLRTAATLTADGGQHPIAPSSLHRVRSTMAPGGIWRLLLGWSLCRQHAPWALTLGALADLEWIPRLTIDGFVVAPASWRIPAPLATRPDGAAVSTPPAAAAALRAWRQQRGLPRYVQVGAEDELLPVDLHAPTAAADLRGHHRVFEIWPPLAETPDRAGRRIEAVVALVHQPNKEEGDTIAAAVAATRAAGRVPAPRHAAAQHQDGEWNAEQDHWQTVKLFGATDRQDHLLLDVVARAIAEARAAGEIEAWFFLRYVEGPGRRPHLRVRVKVAVPPGETEASASARFEARLTAHLGPAGRRGDVVTTERAPYFPESARFGGAAVMPAVHALFEADSDAVCALLAVEAESEAPAAAGLDFAEERLAALVCSHDALASALGLDAGGRKELARRRRDAHASELDLETTKEHGRWFRKMGGALRELLSGSSVPPTAAPLARALRRYRQQATRAARGLTSAQRLAILPPLLHLSSVRLLGLDRPAELRSYDLWVRTLESLERHQPGKRGSSSR